MHDEMLNLVSEPSGVIVLSEFDKVCVRSEADLELPIELLDECCFDVALEVFGDEHKF